jgi:hypothetical protein
MAEGTLTTRTFEFQEGGIRFSGPAFHDGHGDGLYPIATLFTFDRSFGERPFWCEVRQEEAAEAAAALELIAHCLRKWGRERKPVLCDGVSTKEASL